LVRATGFEPLDGLGDGPSRVPRPRGTTRGSWARSGASRGAFGVPAEEVHLNIMCVDRRRQWRNCSNIRHNAAVRSGIYSMGAPGRWIAKPFNRAPGADVAQNRDQP
jgi:hypothetical protein